MKTTQEPWIAATQRDQKGLDARELPRLRRREKCFLLTSPFIEPADLALFFWRLDKSLALKYKLYVVKRGPNVVFRKTNLA
jgi:hypothetical protein